MTNTYDEYLSVHITDMNNVEYEVCFGLYHGSGHWVFWSDTGYEWTIDSEVELVFQEAFNEEGDQVKVEDALLKKAEDMAYDIYWERYADGEYN